MVNNVEEVLSIDEQGRIVVPARVRKALGIGGGAKLLMRLDGSSIVLKPIPEDLGRSINEWASSARAIKAEVGAEVHEESWKWMSRDYAKRKLGVS